MNHEDFRKYLLLTDYYEFSMTNGYLLNGIADKEVVFDYFFRENPFSGSYAILAGVEAFLDIVSDFRFLDEDIEYLKLYKELSEEFLHYLEHMENKLKINGIEEGRVVFANEPILQVQGPIIQCQLLETFLLNIINYSTLCATKANRMWLESDKQSILEFGARRAQGPNGALMATYASMVGGCSGTSNVLAAKQLGLQALGTQAHSWIMSYPSEYEAFKAYVDVYPDGSILLVDTYDTLKSGIPNAIKIGKELRRKGKTLKGVRLDSGDLAKLSNEARKMLDEAGFPETKIVISNEVDEHLIKKFKMQGGKSDIWGIGTKLTTCYDQPALGGVYKLSTFDGDPKIKVSSDPAKTNIPSKKALIRFYQKDSQGNLKMNKDIMFLDSEINFENKNKTEGINNIMIYDPFTPNKFVKLIEDSYDEFEPILKPLFTNNKRVNPKLNWRDARNNMERDIALLDKKYSRISNPERYCICISEEIQKQRQKLIDKYTDFKI